MIRNEMDRRGTEWKAEAWMEMERLGPVSNEKEDINDNTNEYIS
jgi:hypothetical protein